MSQQAKCQVPGCKTRLIKGNHETTADVSTIEAAGLDPSMIKSAALCHRRLKAARKAKQKRGEGEGSEAAAGGMEIDEEDAQDPSPMHTKFSYRSARSHPSLSLLDKRTCPQEEEGPLSAGRLDLFCLCFSARAAEFTAELIISLDARC
jgi:hypothetical protein